MIFGSEMEQMKERFGKLLLGEDMSGGRKGVWSALALSNAITNLAGIHISILETLVRNYIVSILCTNGLQPLCLGNNGVWSLCPRKGKRGGGEKSTCSCLSRITLLNLLLHNRKTKMVLIWRYLSSSPFPHCN